MVIEVSVQMPRYNLEKIMLIVTEGNNESVKGRKNFLLVLVTLRLREIWRYGQKS